MSDVTTPTKVDSAQLPAVYDELVPVEQLVHGKHNPRRVRPTDVLRNSVAQDGLARPLIVWWDAEREVYQITDGWQRYQAATEAGWEQLPVEVCESPLDALQATETASIARQWSKYDWAQYYHSLDEELPAGSRPDCIHTDSDERVHSPQTIRRYLDVLSLPDEIHPLLKDGPDGDTQSWSVLQNYNPDVRQFSDLWWTVAGELGRKQASMSRARVIQTAATAVEFVTADNAMEFVELAAADSEMSIDELRNEVLVGSHHNQYLLVPRVAVELSKADKQAVMEYCHQHRRSLSDIVTETFRSLASELTERECEEEG